MIKKEPIRIMIVEDEQIVALDLKMRLESMGYEVVGNVSMGEKSFHLASENRPDLLLMDIKLAGNIDGIQTAELMRKFYNLPVIYLTAFADKATLERAKRTQPFGYIIKPFSDDELKSNIEMAYYNHYKVSQLEEGEEWLPVILEGIRDAIITVDNFGNLKSMNAEAESLTEYGEKQAIGLPVNEVFSVSHLEDKKPISNLIRDISTDGEPQELLLISHHGAEIPIECRATLIKDHLGKMKGLILIFYKIK
jgi:PAS domain S-box-containing protein